MRNVNRAHQRGGALYRCLLLLYPKHFRERFGRDMAEVFSDRWRAERRRGFLAASLLLIRTVLDVSHHAFAERRAPNAIRVVRSRGLFMDNVLRDVRFAIRSFARKPGFTAVALITIAIGIGANTAIFSVVRPLLLETLPYPQPDRLVAVYETPLGDPDSRSVANPMNYDAWEKRTDVFEKIAGFSGGSATLTGAGDPERVPLTTSTPSYFDVFGVRPLIGRTFTEEEAANKARVIVINNALWQSKLGGDPGILERGITLDGVHWQVVGVMPPEFREMSVAGGWVPLALTPAIRANRNTSFLSVIARLAPGVSVSAASSAAAGAMAQLRAAYPRFNTKTTARAEDLKESRASGVKRGLWMLQAATVVVLLIACANLANLLLAHAGGRAREFAVRTAIGAGRGQLIRQLLIEGIVLAAGGAIVGIFIAMWAVPSIAAVAPAWLPHANELSVRWPDLAMAIALAGAAGIAFSLLPAVMIGRTDTRSMRADSTSRGGTASRSQRRTRALLVASQAALALVLLVGAGLLLRSFARLTSQPIGFVPNRIMTAQLSLPAASYETDDKRRRLFMRLVDDIAAQPGVTAATASTALPFTWWEWMDGFNVSDHGQPKQISAAYRVITPTYFSALNIPVVRGRAFSGADTSTGALVALANEAFAAKYASLGDAIGLTMTRDEPGAAPITIVGIVGGTRHRSFSRPAQAELYFPLAQSAPRTMTLAVRAESRPADLAPMMRRVLNGIDPNLPLAEMKTLDAWVAAAVDERRFYMLLLSTFAAIAAVLAGVGIYGVMTYVVRLRTREIGIRVALGATAGEVVRLVIRQGMMPVLLGASAGIAAALFAARILQDQLFQIDARDPMTLAAVTAAFLAVGFAACWIPSHRTTKVDPSLVLRNE